MADLDRSRSRSPGSRRSREKRALQFALAGGGLGMVGGVLLLLAIFGVGSVGVALLLLVLAAVCGLLFRRVVS